MRASERVGRRLSLRDLNIFLTVAENRSMSKAAAQLAVSQPVVSKAIAEIEHTFGVALLDRNSRGVEPTLYGRALMKRGVAVFDELRQSVNDIEFLADATAGEIRVGGTVPLVAGLVPAVAERLARQHPSLVIDVTEGDFGVLQQALRNREIDLFIGRAPAGMSEHDLASEAVFDDRLVVVAGSRSKWARARKVKLSDLHGERWVLPSPGTVGSAMVDEALQAMSEPPFRATITTSSMAMMIHLLTAGGFLAVLPASTVLLSAKHQPLKALPVAWPNQPRPTVITTLKGRTLNPAATLFIECTRAIAKSSMGSN